jgi:hypothetical protein
MPNKTNYQYYPKAEKPTADLIHVVDCFDKHHGALTKKNQLDAAAVLKVLSSDLKKKGFNVSASGKKIAVPVLYGMNGVVEKQFLIDAFHPKAGIVLEVEAAAAIINYLYLKDIFEAFLMEDAHYLIIAVRNVNATTNGQNDFQTVCTAVDTMYSSNRFVIPLKGIMIIGY